MAISDFLFLFAQKDEFDKMSDAVRLIYIVNRILRYALCFLTNPIS